MPRTKTARDWCELYVTPQLSAYTIEKYGEAPASFLGRFWCKKMQTRLAIYSHQEEPDYVYAEEEIILASDPEELKDAWMHLPKDHPCWERVEHIEAIWPM